MVRRLTIRAACLGGALAAVLFTTPGPAWAEQPSIDDYRSLDSVPDEMSVCSEQVTQSYETGDAQQIRDAMNAEIDCLRHLAMEVAGRFYAPDAFGPDGFEALLQRLSDPLGQMFYVIQTEPSACVPACGTLYGIQALDMYRRFLTTLILDMTERLKDDSPVHTE